MNEYIWKCDKCETCVSQSDLLSPMEEAICPDCVDGSKYVESYVSGLKREIKELQEKLDKSLENNNTNIEKINKSDEKNDNPESLKIVQIYFPDFELVDKKRYKDLKKTVRSLEKLTIENIREYDRAVIALKNIYESRFELDKLNCKIMRSKILIPEFKD